MFDLYKVRPQYGLKEAALFVGMGVAVLGTLYILDNPHYLRDAISSVEASILGDNEKRNGKKINDLLTLD
ncbi:TPA: hypothetical protein HA278_07770 [Candidatus Woesearchaeota archaeon]|jgi:hypothetical protein|nr:hypothetical protein [Candidatus Woesearchaeota archaeon]